MLMSILLVNTSYRPDRSGSSLVVDDICQHVGLRWPISVFCGRLSDHRSARYDVRHYTYGYSRVRSVNVTQGAHDPFSVANYRDKTIAQIFREYLCELEPMIVHTHSLEWLGAGVIEEAKAFGSKVILTMHDWWWICPNKFLWDNRSGKICSLLSARKECSCGPRGFMKEREDYLIHMLRLLDLVTVPSQILKDSLEANGIDFVPISVVPHSVAPPGKCTRLSKSHISRPIRFGYLGGIYAHKGFETLVEAARGFRPDECIVRVYDASWIKGADSGERLVGSRWTSLLAVIQPRRRLGQLFSFLRYPRFLLGGVFRARLRVWLRSWFSIARRGGKQEVLQFSAAYEPGDLDEVMSDIDVLLVPSLARESFSLVTREALARRVPVICSDCGGPMEVVRDGETGAIFRTADAVGLQEKMRLVIGNPQLIKRWKENIRPGSIPVHPESMEEFEKLYAQYTSVQAVEYPET
jgi:glycosyltransferase involved in cell wall biosynthesis